MRHSVGSYINVCVSPENIHFSKNLLSIRLYKNKQHERNKRNVINCCYCMLISSETHISLHRYHHQWISNARNNQNYFLVLKIWKYFPLFSFSYMFNPFPSLFLKVSKTQKCIGYRLYMRRALRCSYSLYGSLNCSKIFDLKEKISISEKNNSKLSGIHYGNRLETL